MLKVRVHPHQLTCLAYSSLGSGNQKKKNKEMSLVVETLTAWAVNRHDRPFITVALTHTHTHTHLGNVYLSEYYTKALCEAQTVRN